MIGKRKYKGVSETIGTVLFVGVAVVLISSVAVFSSSNVKKVESVYVSLSSGYTTDAEGNYIVFIKNTAGDTLRETKVTIRISDANGNPVPGSPFSGKDCDYSNTSIGQWDGNGLWNPGETWSKILFTPPTFPIDVKVVYEKTTGKREVVFSEKLEAPPVASLPDLSVSELYFLRYGQQKDQVLVGDSIDLVANIANLGAVSVPNSLISVQFYDNDNYIGEGALSPSPGDATPTELSPGENATIILGNWIVPYPLGIHRIYSRANPLPSGELSTSNNYRYKDLDVSISIVPTRPSGPNPVITSKDIHLSKEFPKTGDQDSITLFVKNLGDQPISYDDDVLLVVSTSPIISSGSEIFDWEDDIPAPEGSDFDAFTPPIMPENFMKDSGFTKEERENIWKETKWAEKYGQDEDGNDYTFPTCKVRHLTIPVAGQVSLTFTFTAQTTNTSKFLTLYMAVDANPNHYNILPPDLRGEFVPSQRIVFSSDTEGVLEGDDPTDNYAQLTLQVIPRILLVDDDEAETGSEGDITSHVVESLTGAGIQIDKLFISQQMTDSGVMRDVPAYEYVDYQTVGAPQMKDYDIVIWVTGQSENPLTSNPDEIYGGNVEELMKFMDHGGYVWLVGENILEGLNDDYMGLTPDGDGFYNIPPIEGLNRYESSKDDSFIFVRGYLSIEKFKVNADLPGVLYGGSSTNPITGWTGASPYYVEMDDDSKGVDTFSEMTYPDSEPLEIHGMLFQNGSFPGEPYGVYHMHQLGSGEGASAYRAVYLPLSPSHIKYLNEKIGVSARIMKWFNWELRIGNDLAISKMELSVVDGSMPPKFMDTLNVSVWVRNNGPDTLSTSVEFYVTGPDRIERKITPNFPDSDGDNPRDILNLPGGGSEVKVTKQWKATSVGLHTFRAVVDPYHLISEINEENNDISYSTSTITSIVAQNNILVVDDDGSWDDTYGQNKVSDGLGGYTFDPDNPNNWMFNGGGTTEPPDWAQTPDTSSTIIHFMDLMGLQYEVYRVVNTYDGENIIPGVGPNVEKMKRYNLIIWDCGLSGGGPYSGIETLTGQDVNSIESYLSGNYKEAEYMGNYSESFILLGRYVLPEIAPNPIYQGDVYWKFLYNYLGVAGYDDQGYSGTTVYGSKSDEVLNHGITIPLGSQINTLKLIKRPDNITIGNIVQTDHPDYLYYLNNYDGDTPVAIYLENSGPSYFKTSFLPFSLPNGCFPYLENKRTEAFYFLVHWFGVEIYKPDLYGRDVDIDIDNSHPTVGGNYVISLLVGNYGGAPGGGTIRFMDGSKLIYSTNVYLDPGDKVTVEAIWTPLFAGVRTIRVFIDYYNNYDEIFDYIDNIPSRSVNIYFFYDDMENGTGNFRHESVVARINGESPLDFYDPHSSVNTDVIYSWDKEMSHKVLIDENTSHSHPRSFKMYEPPGGTTRNPLDIVMVLDTSGSMGWEVDGVEKIERLKEAAKVFINYLSDPDRVAIYTFTNEGYDSPKLFVDWTFCNSENRKNLNNTIDGLWANGWTPLYDTVGEAANKLYPAPSGRIPYLLVFTDGEANRDFTYGPGRYDYNTPSSSLGQWMNTYYENYYYSSSAGTGEGYRKGLIVAPFTVYTVGLLDSSYHDTNYPNEQDSDTPPWDSYWGSHNVLTERSDKRVEYDLWALAHSSNGGAENNGKYYYVHDPSKLTDVFSEIAQEVVSGGEVTRGRGSNSRLTRGEETIFHDDFENSNPGWTWTHGGSNEGGYWGHDDWERGREYHHSGSYSMGTNQNGNYANRENCWLITPQINLLMYSSATLTFWHSYNIENTWDGGIVEISDDGSTWHKLLPQGGYPTTIRSYSLTHPTLCYENGEKAFSGPRNNNRMTNWNMVTINIPNDYIGKNVYIRFNFASDQYITYTGWYIDDVTITGERLLPGQEPPTPPISPNPQDGSIDIPLQPTLSWSGGDDPNGNNQYIRYDIYLGKSSDNLILITSDLTHKYYTLTTELEKYTQYYWKVVARNIDNGRSTSSAVWAFATGSTSGTQVVERNEDKYLTIGPFSISGAISAYFTFWHKYNILPGKNGGVVMLGFRGIDTDGDGPDGTDDIDWLYVTPLTSYSGNLLLVDNQGQPVIWRDDFGHRILWAWNGKSASGTFGWEYVKVNLLPYIPVGSRGEVYVKLYYKEYGQGTGYGWWIDDMNIRVTRSDSLDSSQSETDKWELYTATGNDIGKLSHSGTHAWWNRNGEGGDNNLKGGIDNSLITRPIDLTNARWARLSFYTRFNINSQSGAPPDCLRVEVSLDNGLTWTSLTLGVRWGWGVSGSEYNASGKSYTGIDSGNNWIEASTLSRLSVDLTPWRGYVVLLRFRVITTNEDGYNHYDNPTSDVKGVLIDDVFVYGKSLLTGGEEGRGYIDTMQYNPYMEWWIEMESKYGC